MRAQHRFDPGDFPYWETVVLAQLHGSRPAVQLERRFTAAPDHMNVGRTMIVGINHSPQSLKRENCWHSRMITQFLSAWVIEKGRDSF
jgi:hypothetical protein